MAKTLEEFFIQQVESKDIEIDSLKKSMTALQDEMREIGKYNIILMKAYRAFLFLVEEGKISIGSDSIALNGSQMKVPPKFMADLYIIRDFNKNHYILEENGVLTLKEDKEL